MCFPSQGCPEPGQATAPSTCAQPSPEPFPGQEGGQQSRDTPSQGGIPALGGTSAQDPSPGRNPSSGSQPWEGSQPREESQLRIPALGGISAPDSSPGRNLRGKSSTKSTRGCSAREYFSSWLLFNQRKEREIFIGSECRKVTLGFLSGMWISPNPLSGVFQQSGVNCDWE